MGLSAFDSILEHKVGLGKYQYVAYALLGLTQVADGAEIISLSILLPILKYEWNISDAQQSYLGSVLFLGFFIGSIASGYVSDKYGRRNALLYISALQFITGILSAFIDNVTAFIIIRGVFGLLIGSTIPLASAFTSELTPVHYRGRSIVIVGSCVSIGGIYATITAVFCLDNLQTGNWRAMLILCSLPALLVTIGIPIFLKESARFLIATDQINEGVDILNYMAITNNPASNALVSQKEIGELKEWRRNLFSEQQGASLSSLFHPKYKKITILMGIKWFSLNFCFHGMIFILPIILSQLEDPTQGKSSQGIMGLAYTIAAEIPSAIIGIYIIEHKYFGRKRTLIYSSAGAAILLFLAYICPVSLFIPLLSIVRMFLKLNFAIMLPFTAELYPTTFRTIGIGYTSGFGRLGSAVMPVVLLKLLNVSLLFPIFIFSIVTAVFVLAGFQIPYDTTGRHLDLIQNEDDDETISRKPNEFKLLAMIKI